MGFVLRILFAALLAIPYVVIYYFTPPEGHVIGFHAFLAFGAVPIVVGVLANLAGNSKLAALSLALSAVVLSLYFFVESNVKPAQLAAQFRSEDRARYESMVAAGKKVGSCDNGDILLVSQNSQRRNSEKVEQTMVIVAQQTRAWSPEYRLSGWDFNKPVSYMGLYQRGGGGNCKGDQGETIDELIQKHTTFIGYIWETAK